MKLLVVLFTALLVADVSAQYIGHPAGILIPPGKDDNSTQRSTRGFRSVEFGYSHEWDIDTNYRALLGHPGPRDSDLSEAYGAIGGGGNFPLGDIANLQLAGRLGGLSQTIEDVSYDEEVFDNSFGFLLGLDARAGANPVHPLRFGLGAQATGSYASDVVDSDFLEDIGDIVKEKLTDKDPYSDLDDRELLLLRTQLFAGGGVDIEVTEGFILSPYGGAGLIFRFGDLTMVQDYMDVFESETRRIAEIQDNCQEFYFGGIDLNINPGEPGNGRDVAIVRVEGQTDGHDWFVGFSFLWNLE